VTERCARLRLLEIPAEPRAAAAVVVVVVAAVEVVSGGRRAAVLDWRRWQQEHKAWLIVLQPEQLASLTEAGHLPPALEEGGHRSIGSNRLIQH
jgi:hypothetical protein